MLCIFFFFFLPFDLDKLKHCARRKKIFKDIDVNALASKGDFFSF